MLTERPVITWRLLENKSRDVQRDFAGGGMEMFSFLTMLLVS